MDWENELTFMDRVMVNRFWPQRSQILLSMGKKYFQELTKNSSIPLDPAAHPRLNIISVGNSHLDSAWKWRKEDAHQKKIFPTFDQAIHHIQKFPEFTFTANAVVHYEWIEDVAPQTWLDIKQAVADNRWEIVGGEYVECDVNLPDGESLIRQRLLGQRYNAKNFQKLAEIAWMDDVFGFCRMLPQIVAKSGGKYFYTNKFSYNNYSIQFPPESPKYTGGERFPFFHFLWIAPDGSELLCTWAKHKNSFHQHLKNFSKHARTVKSDVENVFSYAQTWPEMESKLSDEIVYLMCNAYGKGDGGLGPRPREVLDQLVWNHLGFVQLGTMATFFKFLNPYRDRLPKWQDELYLENHQGTLTSVGMIKENNHTAEVLLHNAESLSVITGLLGGDHFQEEFEDDWKLMLFNQFHDVLPGSSICEVYRDAAHDYNLLFHHLASCIENSLMNVSQTLKTGEKNNYFTVFNALGWARSGYLVVPRRTYNLALDWKNSPLIVQPITFISSVRNRIVQLGMEDATGTDYLLIRDGNSQLQDTVTANADKLLIYLPPQSTIGSYGVANVPLIESAPKPIPSLVQIQDAPEYFILKNNKIQIRITKSTGRITHTALKPESNSPNDTKSGPIAEENNPLGLSGIGYALFKDEKYHFDAWNIHPDYRSKPISLPAISEVVIEESGPLRGTILCKYAPTKAGSTFYCRISLYHDDPKVYGEILIDWQEEYKILKLSLDTRFDATRVHCGSPYYIQSRSTIPRTTYEEAQLEFAFQQFAFLPGNKKSFGGITGIVMYSQSKYGMYARGGLMEMSLLKAPHFEPPDLKYATLDIDTPQGKIVDRGFHRIPWVVEFVTHSKSLVEIVRTAYEYNHPLLALETDYAFDPHSFLGIDTPNVLLTTVKEIEAFLRDAPDWFYQPGMGELPFILRCVEIEGKQTSCTVQLDSRIDIKRVQEVDLLERIRENGIEKSDVTYSDHKITFTIRPYEIKSIMIIGRIPLEQT